MPKLHWITPLAAAVLLVAAPAAHAKGKKKKKGAEPAAAIVGWHQEEGWLGSCYFPPDFESFGVADRRMERNNVLNAMMGQWKGERGDGIELPERTIQSVETVLLGYPEKAEKVAVDNLAQCKKAMTGGGTDAWSAWLTSLPASLTAGECARPLDVTMYWYLDIGTGWQGPASICDDNVVRIYASAMDKYKVDDNGPWIDASGDTSKPAMGDGYVCTIEGCYAGQLVMRFRGQSGAEIIKPIGLELVFDPPEHGTIEFTINDTSYFNNVFKVERGMQHRTSVTYAPAE